MADLRISQLPVLVEAAVAAIDSLAIDDVSASETKKVTVKDFIQAGVAVIDDGSIPGDKVNVTLPAGSVDTTELADKSVTQEKLADGSSAVVTAPLPATGAFVGQIGFDTSTNEGYIWDGNGWQKFRTGILDIQGGTVGDITTQVTIDGSSASVLAQVDDATAPAEFLAGPTASGGEVVLRPIVSDDLPVAGIDTAGIVSVPSNGGLIIDGGDDGFGSDLIINNDTTASSTHHLVTYTEKGLVTGGRQIEAGDLPPATNSSLGAITAGAEFNISPSGELTIANSVAEGTHAVVTYDDNGLITSGRDLTEDDIPELDASKITSGEFGAEQLGECSVTAPKICDYATCLMQEDNPGKGDFLGQFWFTPSTAQLRVYSRGSGPENIWLPVGFGALQANNLRWLGTYDASTDTVVSLTAVGVSEGLTAGGPFPAPSDALSGGYFLCQTAGNSMSQPNLSGISHDAGDWSLCLDSAQGWVHIDAAAPGGGGGGSAQYLNDLLDVNIGGSNGPFSTAPALSLSDRQILKYDSGAGMWRNTNMVDGGSF